MGVAAACPHALTPLLPPPAAQIIAQEEVQASYQQLAGQLGEEMRQVLCFTAPATGQYLLTLEVASAACRLMRDCPGALYRLVPQVRGGGGGQGGGGARGAGGGSGRLLRRPVAVRLRPCLQLLC
jgi:hypothetical protein